MSLEEIIRHHQLLEAQENNRGGKDTPGNLKELKKLWKHRQVEADFLNIKKAGIAQVEG